MKTTKIEWTESPSHERRMGVANSGTMRETGLDILLQTMGYLGQRWRETK